MAPYCGPSDRIELGMHNILYSTRRDTTPDDRPSDFFTCALCVLWIASDFAALNIAMEVEQSGGTCIFAVHVLECKTF